MFEDQNTQLAEILPVAETPHDNTYHILLRKGENLIIPVLNEVFGKNLKTNENILFFPHEYFNISWGSENIRNLKDSFFKIESEFDSNGYLIECQSTNDNSMLWRVAEYGSQIGLCNLKASGKITLNLPYPNMMVLFLRYSEDTPDEMTFFVDFGETKIEHKIKNLKIKDYNLSEIFQKDLLFLLPYYIFNFDEEMDKIEKDNTKLSSLLNEFTVIAKELEDLAENGKISEYQRYLLYRLIVYEVDNLAKDCKNIKKGIHNLFEQEPPKFDIDYIFEDGIKKGEKRKAMNIAIQLKNRGTTIEDIADIVGSSVDEVQKWLNESN